jgi:hypothetical protein
LDGFDPTTANIIGHLTLIVASIVCAVGVPGIPDWIWAIAYVFSAFLAPVVWREKEDSAPVIWFLCAALFGAVTALVYVIGVGLFGSAGQPWVAFRIPGILAPIAALVSLSGFARALYSHFHNGSRHSNYHE